VSVRKFSVTLETVTPLFLGGSEPRGKPELRAPSFRGVMRFWLRALLGGVLGDDTKQIFRHESTVFGSTDHSSPVVVRIPVQRLETDGYNPLLHHKETRFRFQGFKPDQKFTLTLLARGEDAFEQAIKALHLLCLLGGLGRRSRRGFGSLQVVGGDLPALNAGTPDELRETLEKRLNEIIGSAFEPLDSVPSFPTLHPNWAQVKVCRTEFDGWEKAIKCVMEKAHEHKNPALGWAGREGRQSSPVHVHVTKLSNGKYVLVLTTLLSQLNPNLASRADRKKLSDFLEAFDGEVVFGFKEVPEDWLTGIGK